MLKRKSKSPFLDLFKRGNVAADSVAWIIVIVVFVFFGIAGLLLAGFINDEIKDDVTINNTAREEFSNFENRLPSWLDGAVAFLVVGLWLAVIVASFFVDSSPVFFVIVLIVAVALVLVGMSLSVFWDDFTADSDIGSIVIDMPITNFVFNNLAWYALLLVVSIGFVLYAKKQNGTF